MTFEYSKKTSEVFMTKIAEGKHVFRRANDSAIDWKEATIDEMVDFDLNSLCESEIMKEIGRKSRYFWELPYGEGSDFCDWLQRNFEGFGRHSFRIKGFNRIPIYASYTHNEVGEPFLDCEAYLPKRILIDVCNLIMKEWDWINQ